MKLLSSVPSGGIPFQPLLLCFFLLSGTPAWAGPYMRVSSGEMASGIILLGVLGNFLVSGLVKTWLWHSWRLFHHWRPIHGLLTVFLAFGAFLAVHVAGLGFLWFWFLVFRLFPDGPMLLHGIGWIIALGGMAWLEAWGNSLAHEALHRKKEQNEAIMRQSRNSAYGFVVLLVFGAVVSLAIALS